MNQRQSRVAEEIRHIVASNLLRGNIPTTLNVSRLTVVDVWVSADLRLARVYLATPEGADETQLFDAANQQLAKPLRKILAAELSAKNVPSISFLPAADEPPLPPR